MLYFTIFLGKVKVKLMPIHWEKIQGNSYLAHNKLHIPQNKGKITKENLFTKNSMKQKISNVKLYNQFNEKT